MIVLFIFFLLSLVCLLIFMVYKAYHDNIDVRQINIGLSTSRPLSIFFISDIHTRYIRQQTIDSIEKTIDLVIIGGDLLEKKVSLSNVSYNLKILQSFHVPIYFVWGNNDYEVNVEQLEEMLREHQVTILKDTAVNVKLEDTIISLVGLDYYKDGNPDFNSAVSSATGDFSILITHDPKAFYNLNDRDKNQINLVLSGHTHGGQIRILGFGPYSRGGLKFSNQVPVFISEGYGYTKLPLRLGTRSECHIIYVK